MFDIVSEDTIVSFRTLPIYGRVSYMATIRPAHSPLDVLFVVTEQNSAFILEWNTSQNEFVTKQSASLHERVGKPREQGHIGAVDPQSRAVCVDLYEGFLKFAQLTPRGGLGELHNMRIEELYVNDVQFLHHCERPTVVVLYSDIHGHVHVTSYTFFAEEKKLKKGPLSLTNIDAGAEFVVPVPFGGALLLGEQIVYYTPCVRDKPALVVSKSLRTPTVFKAWAMVTPTMYLLGDFSGKIHLLTLVTKDVPQKSSSSSSSSSSSARVPCTVIDMHIEVLGTTSIPSTLSHLGSNVIFVGSQMGDSHVMKIADYSSSSISSPSDGLITLDTYTNIGPISDFVLVDLDHRGQGQVVACSGGFKDGSIVVVRNGVGINEIASAAAPGVAGLWSLPDPHDPARDRYLVLSYLGSTQVLELAEPNGSDGSAALSPAEASSIVKTERTIQCATMRPYSDGILQVTPSSVVSVNELGKVVSQWAPPKGRRIELASVGKGATDILLSLGKGSLVYLKVDPHTGYIRADSVRSFTLTKPGAPDVVEEIACLDVGNSATRKNSPVFCAVGTWDLDVVTLSVPDFRVLCRQKLPGDAVPRSVVVAELEDPVEAAKKGSEDAMAVVEDDEDDDYDDEARANVLCGLGDGHLVTYKVNRSTGALSDCKKLSIGTNAVDLRPVRNPETQGTTHIFASSNRPVIIFVSSGSANSCSSSPTQQRPPRKLLISSINLKEASHACTFRGAAGARSPVRAAETFAMISEGRLVIGTIDDIQKLHVRKTPQNEMPKRVAFQDETRTFGVITIRSDILPTGEEVSTGHVRIFDDQISDCKKKSALIVYV